MNRNINQAIASALLSGVLLLSGCASTAATVDASAEPAAAEPASVSIISTFELFSDRDLAGTWEESAAVAIRLAGNTADCDSPSVSVDGGTVTITEEGVYVLTDSLTDGQIVVSADDTAKVQLVLNGASITSADSAAIYAKSADKVFVTLAADTENALSNGGSYTAIDENNIDAVIFAKTDLTLNGSGSLTINAAAGHGVAAKDELTIAGGSYTVTAASHGISAKDSLAIADGVFAITAGKDGIHAENTDDTSKGTLYIADGTFTVDAQGDALSAGGALQINGGDFTLTTGGGSDTVTMTSDAMGGFGGPMGRLDTAAAAPENPPYRRPPQQTPPKLSAARASNPTAP